MCIRDRCDTIELQVNAKNKRAYEMYRNYGFTEKSINMEPVSYTHLDVYKRQGPVHAQSVQPLHLFLRQLACLVSGALGPQMCIRDRACGDRCSGS